MKKNSDNARVGGFFDSHCRPVEIG